MNHIIDTCPLTEFEGGLKLLHEVVDDKRNSYILLAVKPLQQIFNFTRFGFFSAFYVASCFTMWLKTTVSELTCESARGNSTLHCQPF